MKERIYQMCKENEDIGSKLEYYECSITNQPVYKYRSYIFPAIVSFQIGYIQI